VGINERTILNLKHCADLIAKYAELGSKVYAQALLSENPDDWRNAEETLIQLEIGLQNVQRVIEREIGGSTGDPESELSIVQGAIREAEQPEGVGNLSAGSLGFSTGQVSR
jgi:hypothetical protein